MPVREASLDRGDERLNDLGLAQLAQEAERAAANVLVRVQEIVAERIAVGGVGARRGVREVGREELRDRLLRAIYAKRTTRESSRVRVCPTRRTFARIRKTS